MSDSIKNKSDLLRAIGKKLQKVTQDEILELWLASGSEKSLQKLRDIDLVAVIPNTADTVATIRAWAPVLVNEGIRLNQFISCFPMLKDEFQSSEVAFVKNVKDYGQRIF